MSDISSASFFDDGFEIASRMPSSSGWDISKWLDHVPIDDSATTTVRDDGSFFDDGADLATSRAHSASGVRNTRFGRANSSFYKDPIPRNHSKGFHPGVQRAVGGQIRNTLESMRAMESFHIKDPPVQETAAGEKLQWDKWKDGKETTKDDGPVHGPVKMWIPPTPPDFLIHGKDGHVILVDESEDPIDSRPPPGLEGRSRVGQEPEWYRSKGVEKKSDERSMSKNEQQKLKQEKKVSKQNSEKTGAGKDDDGPDMPLPVPDFLLGGFGFGSKAQSEDSSVNGRPEDARSNYRAPTVESVPESPRRQERKYLNGYDEPIEAYCNANWGGVPVRVGNWETVW